MQNLPSPRDGRPSSYESSGSGEEQGGHALEDPVLPVNSTLDAWPYLSRHSKLLASNTFSLTSSLDTASPDIILIAADNVFFAVHYHILLSASRSGFGGLLPSDDAAMKAHRQPAPYVLSESSEVLNIVLSAVYTVSCNAHAPTLESIAAAIEAMKKYGIVPLQRFICPGKPLYDTILDGARLRPIDTYALASAEDLEELAVACSSYTLSYKLHVLPSEAATKMGGLYLHRLYKLHGMRLDSLKNLLDASIDPHVAKPNCSSEQRQVVDRACKLAGAQVFYNATPALSSAAIEAIMNDLVSSVACPDCQASLRAHVEDIVTKWLLLKRTI